MKIIIISFFKKASFLISFSPPHCNNVPFTQNSSSNTVAISNEAAAISRQRLTVGGQALLWAC
jgi:hypothetical protein